MNTDQQANVFVVIAVLPDLQQQSSLRHLLQQTLPHWQCYFVNDAKAARALLRDTAVTLLLTQWLQPDDNADLLLDFACRHSPATVSYTHLTLPTKRIV